MNVDDIRKAITVVKGRPKTNDFPSPMTLLGERVYVNPPPPQKIKLSESVDVSPQFRAEFNAWLLESFGRKDPLLKENQVLYMAGFGFSVSERAYQALVKLTDI